MISMGRSFYQEKVSIFSKLNKNCPKKFDHDGTFCEPVKDLVAEIKNLNDENQMLVELLNNEKNHLQEESKNNKEIQANLQVKARKYV